ncbi:MAG TPA: hypothetical protein VFW75_01685, partial [Acetobacteraceae bacterium]|nr:hypothetical protein [Acetobacteraceae bacterium]
PDQLAGGELGGAKVLILPYAVALSAGETAAIRRFAAQAGVVIADVVPGEFDEHGRRLPRATLADLFAGGTGKLVPAGDQAGLGAALGTVGVQAAFRVQAPGNDVTTYVYQDGSRTILALQRDFATAPATETVTVTLPRALVVTDLRNDTQLGRVRTVTLTLDPVAPAVVALSDAP